VIEPYLFLKLLSRALPSPHRQSRPGTAREEEAFKDSWATPFTARLGDFSKKSLARFLIAFLQAQRPKGEPASGSLTCLRRAGWQGLIPREVDRGAAAMADPPKRIRRIKVAGRPKLLVFFSGVGLNHPRMPRLSRISSSFRKSPSVQSTASVLFLLLCAPGSRFRATTRSEPRSVASLVRSISASLHASRTLMEATWK
jgi:hypothetical protein